MTIILKVLKTKVDSKNFSPSKFKWKLKTSQLMF